MFGAVAKLLALLSEAALWILVGALLLVLVLTARWWLPWLRGSGRRRREADVRSRIGVPGRHI